MIGLVMARMLTVWRLRYRRFLLCFALLFASLLFVSFVVRFEKSLNEPSNDRHTGDKVDNSLDCVDLSSELLNHLNDSAFTRKTRSLSQYRLQWSVDAARFPLAKPWFMRNGTVKPSQRYSSRLALWPEEADPDDDRIVNQLMYIPPNYNPSEYVPQGKLPLKKILLFFGKAGWSDLLLGRQQFLQDKCPVNTCLLTDNAELIDDADAVIFKDRFMWPKKRPFGQLWILFLLECPMHTQLFTSLGHHVFNWTATYRHDSDLVSPYEKFVSYKSEIFRAPNEKHSLPTQFNVDLFESTILDTPPLQKNYAAGKTKKVAWFVSNCGARNKRLEYARQLSKFISVDIFGSCGRMKCPRSKTKDCFKMLNRDYKFYLAFENSNCRDYITEKLFNIGLGHNLDELNIVPIVMGGHPDDYRRAAPPNSYIHVEQFRSPAKLAQYLNKLDTDDDAYNAYFHWKASPRKGEFIDTFFWCRLCALLHAPPERKKPSISYENIAQWWAPKNVCIDGYRRWPSTN